MSSAAIAPFREAVRRMLTAHEPYPAYVVNRWWEVVDANSAGRCLFPDLSSGAVNEEYLRLKILTCMLPPL